MMMHAVRLLQNRQKLCRLPSAAALSKLSMSQFAIPFSSLLSLPLSRSERLSVLKCREFFGLITLFGSKGLSSDFDSWKIVGNSSLLLLSSSSALVIASNMPSIATTTSTQTTNNIANLKQANGASSSSFVVEPLKPTGALKAYPHLPLTTALGEEFEKSVRLKEILALPKEEGDKVLKDLAILGEFSYIVTLLSCS